MRRIVTSCLAVLFLGAVTLGTAGPAGATTQQSGGQTQYWFGNCSYFVEYQAKYVSGYCDGGDGARFYAWIECKYSWWPLPYTNYGPLRKAGEGVPSMASCGGNVLDAGVTKVPAQ